MLTLEDLSSVTDRPRTTVSPFHRDGFQILHGFIPDTLIDAYNFQFGVDASKRADANTDQLRGQMAAGYGIGTPYMDVPEIRDLCMHAPLTHVMTELLDGPVGLHLNLTGWKSTTRQWHQDRYLNPPCVGDNYIAAWFALADIDPDAGPFEYVPGSHLWPAIDQARMLAKMGEDGTDKDWPWRSEQILGPLFDREIINRGSHIERFIAKKGDVLLWHPRLCHRGSVANNPDLFRPALIAHYSSIEHRCDMAGLERHWKNDVADGWYFNLGG